MAVEYKASDRSTWYIKWGRSVLDPNMWIFEWDKGFEGYWCNDCKKWFPGQFFIFCMIYVSCTGKRTPMLEYIVVVSVVTQISGMEHHLSSATHMKSLVEGGKQSAAEVGSSRALLERHFVVTPETKKCMIAGKFRLFYTCMRQHIPFRKYVFIQRATGTFLNQKTQILGAAGWEAFRQMLRLITDNLTGEIDFITFCVRYLGVQADDGSDTGQHSHLCTFLQLVFPPPSYAAASLMPGLPPTYGQHPTLLPLPAAVKCRQCRRQVKEYLCCSNNHTVCVECIREMVFFLFSSFFSCFLFF